MFRLLIASVAMIIVGANIAFFSKIDRFYDIQVKTNDAVVDLEVELARTDEEKRVGLMNREELEDGMGMLFVYDAPQIASFWMKNTLIPLDIIFIASDLTIQHISYNVQPCIQNAKCPSYRSPDLIQYVLEVPAGFSMRKKITKGDLLELVDVKSLKH